MNWIEEASKVFKSPRPKYFTDYTHCPECLENHEILNRFLPETISMNELGNIGSDPICFATTEAALYYMPAMVRLALETLESDQYIHQFLFHLSCRNKENRLHLAANQEQREFIQNFLAWLFVEKLEYLEKHYLLDEALSASEIWSE